MSRNPWCIVIADDITGAAEMAGIAHRHRLQTALLMWTDATMASRPVSPIETDVLVIATDTRSGSVEEALDTTHAVASFVRRLTQVAHPEPQSVAKTPTAATPQTSPVQVFKKTDSALRGHIAAETTALMADLGYSRALLLAQNPSRGRVIDHGIYTIAGVPLAQTAFRYDPEFPATSSSARQLVRSRYADTAATLRIADATSVDELARQVRQADAHTLLAGAADCFEAFLQKILPQGTAQTVAMRPQPCARPAAPTAGGESWLIVCGSTQSRPLADEPLIRQLGAEEVGMTDEAFHGGPSAPWIAQLEQSYRTHGSVVLAVGQPSTGGREYAIRLRTLMAEAVDRLVAQQWPNHIVIEGGATAFALLGRLGWHTFQVSAELAPGIVSMTYTPPADCAHRLADPAQTAAPTACAPSAHTHAPVRLILKPGSYPWGDLFASPNDLLGLA